MFDENTVGKNDIDSNLFEKFTRVRGFGFFLENFTSSPRTFREYVIDFFLFLLSTTLTRKTVTGRLVFHTLCTYCTL